MPSESTETGQLVERLRAGDRQALTDLFQRYRDRLRRMVELRMDCRIQGRLDASDVLQDGFLDAAARLDGYLGHPDLPPFLWLRLVVAERLAIAHRRHLGTKMRDVGQEVSLQFGPLPEASSAALASMLLGQLTSPTEAAARAEMVLRVQEALNALDPLDRELVALRHFEQLSRAETAQILGITENAVAKRYIRALVKLKEILAMRPADRQGS
jgi:RNA polymerase sigma-70 factor (ECF subfamily)